MAELDPKESKCPGDLEVCCRHPDWRGVPLETVVPIKKPPPKCESSFYINSIDSLTSSMTFINTFRGSNLFSVRLCLR